MARGRKKLTDKHWLYFDADKYVDALHKSLKPVFMRIRDELVDRLRQNVLRMDISSVPVKMDGGGITSDLDRIDALLKSIRFLANEQTISRASGVMRTVVSAMGENFKDTHIGYYYEYGTGTYEDPASDLYRYGDWNKFRGMPRPGAPVVTRGYKKAIAAHTKKVGGRAVAVGAYTKKAGYDTTSWTDMGGNQRVSSSRVGGLPITTPGYETRAYHWYRQAYADVSDTYFDLIKEAVFKVDPRDYINVKETIYLS